MTRQSEKNLLVTVAAFVTTALLVVVFQSSPAQTPSRLPRAADDASDAAEAEAAEEYDGGSLSEEQAASFIESLNTDEEEDIEIGARALSAEELRRGGGRGKGRGKGKGKGNSGPAKFNPAKIKADSIAELAPQMAQAWASREEGMATFHEIAGSTFAHGDPSFAGMEGDEENNFPGMGRTAPSVQRFIDEFACSAGGYWGDSNDDANIWFMIPTTIPLFGSDPVADYSGYVDFISKIAGRSFPTGNQNKNFKYSIGQYSNWVKFGGQKKYKDTADFLRAQKKYEKPLLSASQPTFFKALKNAAGQLDRKPSSAAVGDNCVLVWFFHDIPRDLDEFMNPDSLDALADLHDTCTVIPFFVAPSTATNRKMWTQLGAQITPGRQMQYGKDEDYDGIFYASGFDDLRTNNQLADHFNNYLCMVKNRCLCRINNDGYVYPASPVAPTTGFTTTEGADDGFRAVDDYDSIETTAGTTTEGTTTTAFDTTVGPTAKIPEIDSCCGHQQFGGTAYDSELKTCCDDAVPRSYMDDGSDPCF